MYQFTKSSLAEQLIGAASRGVAVHGIIGAGGASDEFDALTAAGIDVVHYTRYQTLDTLFHHKFSIFDAGQPTAAVATGSFNWTQSAEERNNENELIFMSPELSRDYFFEWLTRYRENGGAHEVGLPAGVASRGAAGPVAVFPNPARDLIAVRWNMERGGAAEIALADELGVTRFHQSGLWSHGVCEAVLQPRVAPGIYVLTVVHDGVTDARRVVILR
jgi:hypothetical protein